MITLHNIPVKITGHKHNLAVVRWESGRLRAIPVKLLQGTHPWEVAIACKKAETAQERLENDSKRIN